jgi:DNA invertase Pin-like site-specific DNA recombinase
MLAYIREGDIVMVTELDRLGRNNQDLTNSLANKYSIKLLVMALMPPACTSGGGK